jgi:hypothetical protein
MNEDEAETLAQRIMCEAAEAHLDVSCAHVREDQHAYVVAIEAHGHTITFTYPDAWTSYFTGVQQNLQLQEQYKQQLARKGASRGTGQ